MDETRDQVLVTGNAAAALGCVYAGATVGAWYPITPATSVMDGFKECCQRFRVDPETGKNNYCIIQAEDELAAAGMVIGANWAGARAFTPTSRGRHRPHERVHRAGVLRRGPVGLRGRAAHGPVHGHADAHAAG